MLESMGGSLRVHLACEALATYANISGNCQKIKYSYFNINNIGPLGLTWTDDKTLF